MSCFSLGAKQFVSKSVSKTGPTGDIVVARLAITAVSRAGAAGPGIGSTAAEGGECNGIPS